MAPVTVRVRRFSDGGAGQSRYAELRRVGLIPSLLPGLIRGLVTPGYSPQDHPFRAF